MLRSRYITSIFLAVWSLTVIGNEVADQLISQAEQHEVKGEYREAADTYQRLVEQLEEKVGQLDITLFEPLLGLGRNLSAQGNIEDAVDVLQRAQSIAHRNDGVFTLRQLGIVDELTDIMLRTDKPLDADTQQRFSFIISNRYYGEGSPEVLAASYKLVNWYLDTGQYSRALTHIKKILDEKEEKQLGNDPGLIQAHILAAKARRLKGICCSEKSLADALEIVQANPDLPTDVTTQVYLELGDAYIISRKYKEAAKYYAMGRQQNEDPQPIAMNKVLDSSRQNYTDMYRVTDSPFFGNRTIKMTNAEKLSAPQQKPQMFLVPMPENEYNVSIVKGYDSIGDRIDSREVIGSPFQFLADQLDYILPHSLKKSGALDEISITLAFTVESTGMLKNIEIIETNAPGKLNRLMRDVLTRTRYRPALMNGTPVRKDHVMVTQKFSTYHHDKQE